MDWALAVEVIKAIAWPTVVFYGIATVRGFKLGPVLDRLKSGKIGPIEISLLEPKEVPQLPASTGIVEATGTAAGTIEVRDADSAVVADAAVCNTKCSVLSAVMNAVCRWVSSMAMPHYSGDGSVPSGRDRTCR